MPHENVEFIRSVLSSATGLQESDFIRNNITANQKVLAACQQHAVPYVIQISSSVLHSKADDYYVQTKTAQEQTVIDSGLPYTVLRPTLMFGWFDRKRNTQMTHGTKPTKL